MAPSGLPSPIPYSVPSRLSAAAAASAARFTARLRAFAAAVVVAIACVAAFGGCGSEAAPATGKPAERIVSLAPSFTEILVALGCGDRVVAIGNYDPEIPGRPEVPRIGDAQSVSMETLVALRPDLVLVNSRATEAQLARTGIATYAPATDRLADVLTVIGALGRRTGTESEAARIVARIDAGIAAAARRATARKSGGAGVPRVLVVVERRPLYAAGGPSYLTDLLRAIGAENVLADVDAAWPALSEESAVARAPDVILDASEGDNSTDAGRAALLKSWERFPSIPAVRDGRVRVIREDILFRAGPRIPEALERLEALVFEETPR